MYEAENRLRSAEHRDVAAVSNGITWYDSRSTVSRSQANGDCRTRPQAAARLNGENHFAGAAGGIHYWCNANDVSR